MGTTHSLRILDTSGVTRETRNPYNSFSFRARPTAVERLISWSRYVSYVLTAGDVANQDRSSDDFFKVNRWLWIVSACK